MADGNQTLVKEVVDAVKGEIKQTYEALDKKTNDLAEVLKAHQTKAVDQSTLDGHLKSLKDDIEKLGKKADDLDTKLSRPDGDKSREEKSPGRQVIESEAFKELQKRGSGRTGKLELKAAITNTGTTVGSQTLQVLTPRQRVNGLIVQPEQPLMIRDLLPVGTTTSNSIEFIREATYTNAAAPVAENTTKAESAMTFSLDTAPVRTIAHWIPASRQVLADAPQLMSHIDNRLRYGLKLKEEQQLLLGDGTGQNLEGLIPQATAYSATGIPATPTDVDAIRWAKLQVRKAFYPATAVVLNPEDWAQIELLKDLNDQYLFSMFQSGAEPRLWGLRVVESDSMPQGEFMVGAFSLAAELWDREQASVEVSTENSDNFVKNMVTILAEERLALTVYRPEAFVHGDLPSAA
ncbi:MAG: phage major capsid protein [Alsobacter sp.]